MKSTSIRIFLLTVVLALTAQLSLAGSSLRAGQNSNSSNAGRMGGTMTSEPDPGPGPQPGVLCRRRCAILYRRCLQAAGRNPARRRACLIKYRNCLRLCK